MILVFIYCQITFKYVVWLNMYVLMSFLSWLRRILHLLNMNQDVLISEHLITLMASESELFYKLVDINLWIIVLLSNCYFFNFKFWDATGFMTSANGFTPKTIYYWVNTCISILHDALFAHFYILVFSHDEKLLPQYCKFELD